MKARSHSVFRTVVLFCICLGALILGWKIYDTNAQGNCTPPPRFDGAPKWKTGAVVPIYYRQGDFSAVEKQAIERAINNWNDANGPDGNNSGVFIGGPAETALPFSAFNCLGAGCPSAN